MVIARSNANPKKSPSLNPPRAPERGATVGYDPVVALLDMLGVASIMPFMTVSANPDLVETNAILKASYAAASHLGVDTPEQFLSALSKKH